MGKKKSFYKKFAKKNKIVLAALSGAAAGIALASVLGTEKAKEMLQSVEGNMKDFGNRLVNGLQKEESEFSRP